MSDRKNKHRHRSTDVILRQIVWDGPNLLDRIAQLGPGICTIAGTEEILEFDVQKNGRFGVEPDTQDVFIRARFCRMVGESRRLGVTMRTFLYHRMVDIPRGDDPSKTVCVPVKEIRSYIVKAEEKQDRFILRYAPIPITELKLCYSLNPETGQPIEPLSPADHILVQDVQLLE